MQRILAALLVLLIGLQPTLLHAQQSGAASAQAQSPRAQTPAASTSQSAPTDVPDIDALGVSFERIKRLLADRAPSENKSPLKLNYYVEVVALAPRLQLFTREELAPTGGPIPWGPPTHADILSLLTPIEFRSPTVPVSSLAILGIMKLAEWEAARMKRIKAEEERKKRDEEERKRQKALQESGLVVVKPPK
jgi:hypothetical protein